MSKATRAAILGALAPVLLGMAGSAASAQEATAPPLQVPPVEVVGTTPVLGTGVPKAQVPANVQVIDKAAIQDRPLQSLNGILAEKLSAGSYADTQGNAFNTTLNIRGYTASPILGQPQGVAVYENGVRLNDPFGDVVTWALVPSFAINRVEVLPGANPVFGLNALGGAVSLQMKDGFSAPGGSVHAEIGSHGQIGTTAEYGQHSGVFGVYGGTSLQHDDGWRDHSPSDVYLGYLDLAARTEKLDAGLSLQYGDAEITGNGPSPKELLEDNYRAIFTQPDKSQDQQIALALRANYALNDQTSVQGNTYYRHSHLHTVNGDDADFDQCTGIGGSPRFLCSNAGEDDETLATDKAGTPIPAEPGIDGVLNETITDSNGTGGSLQLSDERELLGRKNDFAVGGSVDLGFVNYQTRTRAGELNQSRKVESIGYYIGGDDFNTKLQVMNQYYGLYLSDTYAVTPKLSATAAARLNVAAIDLDDHQGSALNGSHDYWRVNPSVGLTYQVAPWLNLYTSYSEANRTPTAAELACADPDKACRVPNAFTSDPALDQVVSRSIEIGARGRLAGRPGVDGRAGPMLNWSIAGFNSWNKDDIIFVSSGPVLGSGYFTNAGTTRRLGFELGLDGSWRRLGWYANYGFVRATFESGLTIASPNNPKDDADGNIEVKSGDRIPGIPEQTFKFGLTYALTDRWTIGGDGNLVSSRPYQGDEGNDLGNVPNYAIFGAETDYRILSNLRLQLRVENIFDRRYYSYGTLGDPSDVFADESDPRFLTPGQPRTYEAALTLTF